MMTQRPHCCCVAGSWGAMAQGLGTFLQARKLLGHAQERGVLRQARVNMPRCRARHTPCL